MLRVDLDSKMIFERCLFRNIPRKQFGQDEKIQELL